MTDKPILFSTPMVRALFEGRKTQTRRIIKPQPSSYLLDDTSRRMQALERCLYAVGDRLWVREAWRTVPEYDELPPRDVPHGAALTTMADTGLTFPNPFWGRIRQSMFMPRWASRLTLIVTDVRVERLQDISEDDARAEGITQLGRFFGLPDGDWDCASTEGFKDGFANLWEYIHGPGAWDLDPWVAAYTFRVIQGNIDQIGEAS